MWCFSGSVFFSPFPLPAVVEADVRMNWFASPFRSMFRVCFNFCRVAFFFCILPKRRSALGGHYLGDWGVCVKGGAWRLILIESLWPAPTCLDLPWCDLLRPVPICDAWRDPFDVTRLTWPICGATRLWPASWLHVARSICDLSPTLTFSALVPCFLIVMVECNVCKSLLC